MLDWQFPILFSPTRNLRTNHLTSTYEAGPYRRKEDDDAFSHDYSNYLEVVAKETAEIMAIAPHIPPQKVISFEEFEREKRFSHPHRVGN